MYLYTVEYLIEYCLKVSEFVLKFFFLNDLLK